MDKGVYELFERTNRRVSLLEQDCLSCLQELCQQLEA